MNIPYIIKTLKYDNYSQIAKMLDFMWGTASKNHDPGLIHKYIIDLNQWLSSINNLRLFRSKDAKLTYIQNLNINRAKVDITSLIQRLTRLMKFNKIAELKLALAEELNAASLSNTSQEKV